MFQNINRSESFVSVTSLDDVRKLQNQDITYLIFSFLDSRELGRSAEISKPCSQVCQGQELWNKFDLRTLSSRIAIFDKLCWNSLYGLNIEDSEPSLNQKIVISKLWQCLSLCPEKNNGVVLLTMPKGLTLNRVIQWAWNQSFVPAIIEGGISEIADIPIPHTYRIIVPKGIFADTPRKSISEQEQLLKQYGYGFPKVLEMSTVFLTADRTNSLTLTPTPGTLIPLIRCVERYNDEDTPLAVGNPSPGRMHINAAKRNGAFNGAAGVFRIAHEESKEEEGS